jgi:CheY-like chemotaxis protein
VNIGSEFTVKLPLIIKNKEKTAVTDKDKDKASKKNKKLNILLIEDNSINQLLAQTILNGLGYEVTLAENGQIALDILSSNEIQFDIVLMDLMMPVMNGYEASTAIRKNERNEIKNIPIIAITADVTSSVKEKCFEIGINAYISKPFDAKKLNEKIVELTKF